MKKKLLKNTVLCIFTILCISLMSSCYLLPKEEKELKPPLVEPPKIEYNTLDVKKGTIENKITCSSTFLSDNQVDLFFKYKSGNLKNVYIKAGDTVKAGDLIAELDNDNLKSQITLEEINLKKLQLDYNMKTENLNKMQNQYDISISNGTKQSELDKALSDIQTLNYNIKIAELNIEAQNIKLNDLYQQLEKSQLYSSIPGQVIFLDKINAGDPITAFKTIATIADPTKLQLLYKGDKSSSFQVGASVEVNYKSKTYSGRVMMTSANAPLDMSDKLKDSVYINAEGLPSGISIGDSASITLIIDKKDNVIVLPKGAVTTYNGRNYVQVLENGVRYEKDVQLGIQTPTEVEIVKGINEGEKIITIH